jgi:pimeloyl-ACP methyl ester carboxylesterase
MPIRRLAVPVINWHTRITTFYAHSDDDRRIAVKLSGDHAGEPVFYLHGTPGSRVGPRPTDRELTERRVWLISFDRPGYGRSDRLPSRTGRFGVLGRSGGGPHALACAALLPHPVTKAAALVSLAPRPARGLDWFDGMAKSNIDAYTTATWDPEMLADSTSAIFACRSTSGMAGGTSSHRSRTRSGWPSASRTQFPTFRPTALTSARLRWSRTCSRGCRAGPP